MTIKKETMTLYRNTLEINMEMFRVQMMMTLVGSILFQMMASIMTKLNQKNIRARSVIIITTI